MDLVSMLRKLRSLQVLTSLVYKLKEGKWQKSLINDSDDFTSDSECESESKE